MSLPAGTKTLVVGATGITGYPLVDILQRHNARVVGLYKSNLLNVLPGVEYIQLDISDFQQCKEKLSGLTDLTHIFYVCWARGQNKTEESQLNLTMFKNVLNTLVPQNPKLQRIILQTGSKYYGDLNTDRQIQPKIPAKEDQARVPGEIFYYPLEDYLAEIGQDQTWTWVVLRPSAIIGFGIRNPLNLGTTLAVYTCIQRYLNDGREVPFPGSGLCYYNRFDVTDVRLLMKMHLWAMKEPRAANNAFNCVNGDTFTWEEMWPAIVGKFGGKPVEPVRGSQNPRIRLTTELARQQNVWNELVDKHSLQKLELNDLVSPDFAEAILTRNYGMWSSMEKAQTFGFVDSVVTKGMFMDFIEKLLRLKIVPSFEPTVIRPPEKHSPEAHLVQQLKQQQRQQEQQQQKQEQPVQLQPQQQQEQQQQSSR